MANENTQQADAQLEKRAAALVNALAKHDYGQAMAHFDSNMTSLMPAAKLEELWTAIQAQAGAFVEQDWGRIGTTGGKPIVDLHCRFEKGNIEVYVAFDGTGNVTGLHVGPEKPDAKA